MVVRSRALKVCPVLGPKGERVEVRFFANDKIIIRVFRPGQLAILNSFTGKNNDYSNLTLQMLPPGSPMNT